MGAVRCARGWWLAAWMLLGVGGARAQGLVLPAAVAYDAAGDLFFVDTNRNQVFEVSLAGVLTVAAGSGVQGFSGDGGAAVAAELNAPQGVAVGSDGTVYVADTGNQRVRAISQGMIATFAGTGVAGFGGDGGASGAAMLRGPTALAMDASGALLICDTGNHRVRRVSAGVMATLVGSGVQGFAGDGGAATAAELDSPMGIVVAADGRVFVADTHNQRVRVVAGGVITALAGTGVTGFAGDGGAAMGAELSLPRGLGVDAAGGLLIADADNQRIRRVSAAGVISTVAGSGVQGFAADGVAAGLGSLDTPRGVGVSGVGATVFADSPNGLVREVAANGEIYTIAVLSVPRVTAVTMPAGSSVYGDGTVGVSVAGGVGTPLGVVGVSEGGVVVGSGTLVGGAVSVGLGMLGVGSHTFTATYAGDGLNPAGTASAVVQVVKAPSTVVLSAAQSGYAGMPLVMTAAVAAVYAGAPGGVVSFLDGGNVVATGTVVNGVASGTYLAPAMGMHVLSASYAGDVNFVGSASGTVTMTAAAMPDFSVTAMAGSEGVQGGLVASFPLQVTSSGGAFTGSVVFSVTGLQKGAVATFSPVMVVPGATGAVVTMSVATVALTAGSRSRFPAGMTTKKTRPADREKRTDGEWMWSLAGIVVLVGWSKRWRRVAGLLVLMAISGCGARTLSTAAEGSQTYALTVTATGTNLVGAIVTHTTNVALEVE